VDLSSFDTMGVRSVRIVGYTLVGRGPTVQSCVLEVCYEHHEEERTVEFDDPLPVLETLLRFEHVLNRMLS
jgi:hypothetical protein